MKINVFIPTSSGGKFATDQLYNSFTGQLISGPKSPEDEIILAIDESKMSAPKVLAQRFLTFLGNHRLNMKTLKELSPGEQARLKKEFLGG
jgi:hypothetical protein